MKYHITTFGCQANEADSEKIAGLLEKIGYKKALAQTSADLLVLNTCSVRQTAEDRVFGLNKKMAGLKNESASRRKKLKIILAGCMNHYPKEKLKKRLPYIDIFLPIKDLIKLPQLINEDYKDLIQDSDPKYQSNFRAYIPISEGCDNFCSYCIVPYARGKEISRSAEEIICEAEKIIKTGYKEIWLLGQNVNSYKNSGIRFPDLLKKINNISGNFWLRFASPHPKNFSDELIQAMAKSEKFAHYINLPVQSGDNEILKKMNRPYSALQYKELVKKIRKSVPDIAMSTDVIVGFPGETEKQFENTAKLFEKIKFDMAFISQYSPRPGTKAAKMEDDVPKEEKKTRDKILTNILKKTALENNKKYIGKTEEVLIANIKKDHLLGKNKAYKTVKIFGAGDKNLIGEFRKVKIKKALEWGLEGELIK